LINILRNKHTKKFCVPNWLCLQENDVKMIVSSYVQLRRPGYMCVNSARPVLRKHDFILSALCV